MQSIVLFSGGLDSATALYQQIKEHGASQVCALSFDYGSKHNKVEFRHAKQLCARLGVRLEHVSLPFINELFNESGSCTLLQSGGNIPLGIYNSANLAKTVVPFRNGIMLSIAAGLAQSLGAKFVVLANHGTDHTVYADCRAEFINAMGAAIAHATENQVQLLSPFCHMNKAQVVALGQQLAVAFEQTYSCYNGQEQHCGLCGTCLQRKEAFAACNIDDRTVYAA